jgi:hypothetical protein
MTELLARALLALAVHGLGERRHEWARAIEVEFETAREDGRPLAFAFGCLIASFRELPGHEEGRLTLATYALAFVLAIPTSALLLTSMLTDFPLSYLAHGGVQDVAGRFGDQEPLVSDANLSATPPLAVLVAILAGTQLRLAWLVIERDWPRVTGTSLLMAAITATLLIFTGIVFDDFLSALAYATALAIELTAIAALARWHDRVVICATRGR